MAIFDLMKQRLLTLSALLLGATGTFAQSLSVTPSTVNFGFVTELTPDSVQVWLHNHTPNSVSLDVQMSTAFYGDRAFDIHASSQTISAYDSVSAWIVFHPNHNIDYSGQIVLGSNGAAGAVAIDVGAHGRFSKSYYTSTEDLSEESLKTALNTLLAQNYSALSYDGARDQMYGSVDNVGGVVTCVYTGRSATFNDRPGANANNINCEHTFPQGFFNSASPMRSDIHHLFPTDAVANSTRNNHPFGVVANPTWTQGGSKYGGGTFEPRDDHKGAAARGMLYFVIRYQDYSNFFAPQEAILKTWNKQFAPTAFEMGRNDDIFAIQNNRNPFVDYPQFADRITNFVSNSSAPQNFELSLANDTIFLPQDASVGYQVIYRTAVLNTGNQPVFVQPKPTGRTDITYVNNTNLGGTLMPGEGKVLDIAYNYGATFNSDSTIQLLTNLPAGIVNIPIRSTAFDLGESEVEVSLSGLYPNPTSDYFQVPEGASSIRVYNAHGQLMTSGDELFISVHDWSAGSYVVVYQRNGVTCTETLVVAQ